MSDLESKLAGLHVPESVDRNALRPLHSEMLMSVTVTDNSAVVAYDRCYGCPSQQGIRKINLVLNAHPTAPYWTVAREKFYPMPTGPVSSMRGGAMAALTDGDAALPMAGYEHALYARDERERSPERDRQIAAHHAAYAALRLAQKIVIA